MYKMEGSSAQFNDAAMMLNFYENNPVGNLDGIGECVRPFNKSMSHPGKNFSDHQKHKIATKSASLDSIRKLSRTDVSYFLVARYNFRCYLYTITSCTKIM